VVGDVGAFMHSSLKFSLKRPACPSANSPTCAKGCGKSSIVVRYVDGSFSGTVLASTESGYVCVEYLACAVHALTSIVPQREKSFEMDGKRIQLRIFDTASQERFRTITSSYYDGAHGAFIVFDLERRGTFERIDDWTNDVERYSSKIKKIVVGNKSDKNETRSVADSAALNRAKNLGMPYVLLISNIGMGD
jgi:small GTP-binding protein